MIINEIEVGDKLFTKRRIGDAPNGAEFVVQTLKITYDREYQVVEINLRSTEEHNGHIIRFFDVYGNIELILNSINQDFYK